MAITLNTIVVEITLLTRCWRRKTWLEVFEVEKDALYSALSRLSLFIVVLLYPLIQIALLLVQHYFRALLCFPDKKRILALSGH